MLIEKNRASLDIVRGLSTIIIVWFHYSCALVEYGFDGFSNYLYHYANNYWGTLGVNLFFLLSGAGLWLGYAKNCDLKAYYKRRWLKIFPMFYLCLLPFYFLNAVLVKKDFFYGGSPWKMLLSLIGMDGYLRGAMNNYYVTGEWFLGVIILLYLLFPLLRRLLFSKAASLAFTAVLFALCCIDEQAGLSLIAGRGWFGYYLFVFWLGMLLIKYEKALLVRVKWHACLPPIIFLLFVKLPVPWKNDMLSIALSLCVVMLFLCFDRAGWRPVLFTAFCRQISKYSYAIFLVHHVIIDLFFKVCFPIINSRNAPAFLLLLCAVIYICAAVLYRVERAVLPL